jgi:hypothetical protein
MRTLREHVARRLATWGAWSLVALTVALGLAALPLAVAVANAARGAPLPPELAANLPQSALDWLAQLLGLGEALGFAVLGAVLVARQHATALGWLFCALGFGIVVEYFTAYYALDALFLAAPGTLPGGLAAGWVQHWVWLVNIMLLLAFVPLRFPTGRLLSPRWRPAWWLVVGATAAVVLLVAILPGPLSNHLGGAHVTNPLGVAGLAAPALIFVLFGVVIVMLLASILLSVVSLVVRLRRARGVERQQIKWVAYCAILLALLFVAQFFENTVLGISLPLLDQVFILGSKLGLIGLPVATGIAILRYRLFDIDLIIRLTLIYGTLTALLAAVYLGLVLAAQTLVRGLTGERGEQPPVIVASTLLVVALATPLRRGVQAAIDRRFYRRKYDAEQTVAAFGQALRSEVELERLRERVLAVVEETMQPAHAALWLRAAPPVRPRDTR